MLAFVAVFHIIVAILLVIFVMLQDAKGGALGALGGGSGSSTMWGSTGAGNILVTITKWLSVVFAITCISLAYLTTKQKDSVVDNLPTAQAPVEADPIDATKVDDTAAAPAKDAPATETKK
jgi:preprotein translocase subunit SecG